jgi:general secretion pathway protein G
MKILFRRFIKMKKTRNKPGFTLMEIMAVLIIIGLLATLVGTQALKQVKRAQIETTKANLKTLHNAVIQFYADTGRYPTEEEGLTVLIEQPSDVENWDTEGYLEQTQIPKDGWGQDFIYERFPESGKQFVIRSCGPDREPGTDDDMLSTDAK